MAKPNSSHVPKEKRQDTLLVRDEDGTFLPQKEYLEKIRAFLAQVRAEKTAAYEAEVAAEKAALSKQQTEPTAGHTLLPCPFCGHQPDEENMIDSTHPINHEGTLWTTGCLENEGGCGASVLAGSRQEAIDKWNTRAALSKQQGEPVAWEDVNSPGDFYRRKPDGIEGRALVYAAPPAPPKKSNDPN